MDCATSYNGLHLSSARSELFTSTRVEDQRGSVLIYCTEKMTMLCVIHGQRRLYIYLSSIFGEWVHFRGSNSYFHFCLPYYWGSTLKKKNFFP